MHVQLNSVAAATAPGADGAAPPQPRLVRAAHEFEAQMMKELLKPMTNSSLTGEDEDSGADSGSGGALGRALSEQGGFGIANSIVRDLSHSGNKTITGQVTGKLHGNTVMKALK
jgi:Rod binding domain-containing protein